MSSRGSPTAGASTQALLLAALAVMVVGGFSAAGAKYGEERTFWEHEHAMIEQERLAIEAATGWFTAWLTGLPVWRLVRRNVVFGAAAMLLSLAVGSVVDL